MPTSLTRNDKHALKLIIGEITNSLLRIDSERETIKDMVNDASKKFEIDKKQIRKIANTMFKHNYADVQAEHEEFEYLYESVVEDKAQDAA